MQILFRNEMGDRFVTYTDDGHLLFSIAGEPTEISAETWSNFDSAKAAFDAGRVTWKVVKE